MIQLEKVISSEERFILVKEYIKTLESLIDEYWENAAVSTKEREFLALCLDYHKSISIDQLKIQWKNKGLKASIEL